MDRAGTDSRLNINEGDTEIMNRFFLPVDIVEIMKDTTLCENRK
jgi:hypothetical protein